MTYDINSVHELVECLGGDTAVAREFGISQPAVANWKARGEIGSGWHLRLLAWAARIGKSVNPVVFGMNEAEFAPLGARRPLASELATASP